MPASKPALGISSERALQDAVDELFGLYGYRRTHFRPARTLDGWATALQGDVGFADNFALRPPRMIFAELKDATGQVDEDQAAWLDYAEACGMECYVWRPVDLARIPEVLSGDLPRKTHWRATPGLGKIAAGSLSKKLRPRRRPSP